MNRTGSCRVWLRLLSDAFAQGFDEPDCKLQNLVRFDLSSLLLRVVPRQSRQSTCQESSRCQVSSATLRSDAAVRMKFLTPLKLDPTLFAKKVLVLCCVGVKHEESLHKFCLARA